jgi:4-hydroxy-2-oxoheptanedioate aldolase
MGRTNRLKARLKAGETVFGTWSMLGAPSVVNVLGSAGLDFVVIDMEHGPVSFETVEQQILAIEVAGCTPIVRLGMSSETDILHALEIGVQSIMVSHISTPDEAARVVRAALYRPEGDRGLSPFTRNHGYSDTNIAEKLRQANEQIFTGVLVEGEEGLANLEEICEVPGLDMVYLGIYDLAQSMGVQGDVKNPRVTSAARECASAINRKGLVAGSVARDREHLEFLFAAGFRFLSYRVDCAVLLEGFETARGWYEGLGR